MKTHPDHVTALERGLDVLRVMSNTGVPLTITTIASVTGLPRATVRRSLMTLERTGYARKGGALYWLTEKVQTFRATPMPSERAA